MIKPNMATMLAFVATDASVAPDVLQKMTEAATDVSFNRITVDSDTSTNDSCILMATGQAETPEVKTTEEALYRHLLKTVKEVMLSLAQQIIRDGEGATKFIEVKVKGARSDEDALAIAYSVAESPLFKTAMSASDANWGRILMAVGKAPVSDIDVGKINLFIGDVCIASNGQRHPDYTEAKGAEVVAQEEIIVTIDLSVADSEVSIWTSDLSHEYVTINAEYRT